MKSSSIMNILLQSYVIFHSSNFFCLSWVDVWTENMSITAFYIFKKMLHISLNSQRMRFFINERSTRAPQALTLSPTDHSISPLVFL